jgi:hypothetical protein
VRGGVVAADLVKAVTRLSAVNRVVEQLRNQTVIRTLVPGNKKPG